MHHSFQTLTEIYTDIIEGRYKSDIKSYRNLLRDDNYDSAVYYKSMLCGFTVSGKFEEIKNRGENGLVNYYGLMVLDIDGLRNEEEVKIIFDRIISISYTLMAFISPSGKGIKIIVPTDNTDSKKHTFFYKQLVKYYEDVLGVILDSQTCDVARLCFFSYDPNAYFNIECKVFEFNKGVETDKIKNKDDLFKTQMNEVVKFTDNKQKFKEGNRNRYVYLLSKNSSGFGLSKKLVLDFCLERYIEDGFTSEEITTIVNSSYMDSKSEFGKWSRKLKKLMDEKTDTIIQRCSIEEIEERYESILHNNFSEEDKKLLNTSDDFGRGIIRTLEIISKHKYENECD